MRLRCLTAAIFLKFIRILIILLFVRDFFFFVSISYSWFLNLLCFFREICDSFAHLIHLNRSISGNDNFDSITCSHGLQVYTFSHILFYCSSERRFSGENDRLARLLDLCDFTMSLTTQRSIHHPLECRRLALLLIFAGLGTASCNSRDVLRFEKKREGQRENKF